MGTGQTTFAYDNADRLTTQTFSTGQYESYVYDDAGNLTSATRGGVTTTYTYDNADRS